MESINFKNPFITGLCKLPFFTWLGATKTVYGSNVHRVSIHPVHSKIL